MVRISQNLFVMLLISIMQITSFPLNNIEDISNDGKVDIEDVIMVVKGVARTVESSESIKSSVKRAVTVISVAAGLKKILTPLKDNNLSKSAHFSDLLYLISSVTYNNYFRHTKTIEEQNFLFKTIEFPPISPPPQKASFIQSVS